MSDFTSKTAAAGKEKRDYETVAGSSQDHLQKDLHALKQDVSRLAQQLTQLAAAKGADAMHTARANLDGVLSEASTKGKEAADAMREVKDNFANAVEELIEKRPYTTLAAVLALGFVFGATWRR